MQQQYTLTLMRILIADDHALFRDGIRLVLQQLEHVIVSEASNRKEIEIQLKQLKPDILLLDLDMPGVGSVHEVKTICESAPKVAVIVISGNDTTQTVSACLNAGALGFLPKSMPSKPMLNAIKGVYAGEIYYPPTSEAARQETIPLSPRQKEIYALLTEGKPNKEISRLLNITESTVKQHITEIFRKLNVSSRTQAIQKSHSIHISIL